MFEVLRGFDSKALRAAISRFWALRAAAITTGVDLLTFLPATSFQPNSTRAPGTTRRSVVVRYCLMLILCCVADFRLCSCVGMFDLHDHTRLQEESLTRPSRSRRLVSTGFVEKPKASTPVPVSATTRSKYSRRLSM